MGITLVTKDATLDNLSASDYRDIFTELRQNLSLDKLIGVMGSTYSKAAWNRYERGDYELTRSMRNELRRAVNLPSLPATVADTVTSHTSPNAAVWMVGEGTAQQVILISNHDDLTLHINGDVAVIAETPCNPSNTEVISTKTGFQYIDTDLHMQTQIDASTPVCRHRPKRHRPKLVRPVASLAQDAQRLALGRSWCEVIDAGLSALS
jgi:hypothetical protein